MTKFFVNYASARPASLQVMQVVFHFATPIRTLFIIQIDMVSQSMTNMFVMLVMPQALHRLTFEGNLTAITATSC